MRTLQLSALLSSFVSSQQIPNFPPQQGSQPAWSIPAPQQNPFSIPLTSPAQWNPYASAPASQPNAEIPYSLMAQLQVNLAQQQQTPTQLMNPAGPANPNGPFQQPNPALAYSQSPQPNQTPQQNVVLPYVRSPSTTSQSNPGSQFPQQPAQNPQFPQPNPSLPFPTAQSALPLYQPGQAALQQQQQQRSSPSSSARANPPTRSSGSVPQSIRTRKGRVGAQPVDPYRRPLTYPEQQLLLLQQQQQQQPQPQAVRSPTLQPQRAIAPTAQPQRPLAPTQTPRPLTSPPTPLSRLPIAAAPSASTIAVAQQSHAPPPPLRGLGSRTSIPVGPRTSSSATSLYPGATVTASLYPSTNVASSLYPSVATASSPNAPNPAVDQACVTCVCDNWSKCCYTKWTTFCDGLTSTVCAAQCPGTYSGTLTTLPVVRSYPASVGEFCGRGIWMRPVECDASQGLQCLSSSNVQVTQAEIGLCFHVSPPPPPVPNVCSDPTPRCACTVENCGGTRGWNGVQGVCQAGEDTSAFEMLNCQVTPAMCERTADKCECAFSACWGWTSSTEKCLIEPQCVDRRSQLADAAVQGFRQRNIQALAWDFDSTIISVDTASGSYPDLTYLIDRMDQDFITLAKAAQRQGMKQAITSYNSMGMVFVDGHQTGGPELLKAILAKVLGEDNNFLVYAFESKDPWVEGKNVHLQMLMQQLRLQHKSTVLLIDDYEVNVDIAKEAGYSTAKARTGRGVDLRMLAS